MSDKELEGRLKDIHDRLEIVGDKVESTDDFIDGIKIGIIAVVILRVLVAIFSK